MVTAAKGGLTRGAQLFGLSAMAVGQPLLDLIAQHPAFLVAHRASPGTIWSLAVVLLVGPPVLVWIVEAGAGRLSRRFASWLRIAVTGALAATVAMPIANNAVAIPAVGRLSVGVGVGVLFAVAYSRSRWVGRFLTALSVAPFAAAILFATREPIAKLLHPEPARAAAALSATADFPPILFVIFDELPLTSLLDEQNRIDPVRYPAFARLAGTSTWFRGASAVHFESTLAVPAILTGRFPIEDRLPTAGDHPENLFSLLRARYRIRASEPITALAPRADERNTVASLLAIVADLRTIYLHFLLPVEFTAGLPSLAQSWKGFGENDDPQQVDRIGAHTDRIERLVDFTASIDESARDEPTLYFLHSLLPHPPWEYLPSGRAYYPANAGIPQHSWGPTVWWATQGYQQHLLQLIYTDGVLGRILERLERVDLFDAAMIIITSDHGATFWPNDSRRGIDLHPEDVLSVPLIIKAPHQHQAVTIDRVVESVDIVPSIADLLGIEIPWVVDGCSAFDDSCAERSERVLAGRRFPADTPLRRESLAMKLDLFESGTSGGSALAGLYAIGPRPELLGRSVREFDRSPGASVARIVQGAYALASLQPERYVVARVTGLVVGPLSKRGRAEIAVSIAGVIRAVVPALPFKNQGLLFSALVPEEFARTDPVSLKIFAVEGSGENTRLRRLRTRFEAFRPR